MLLRLSPMVAALVLAGCGGGEGGGGATVTVTTTPTTSTGPAETTALRVYFLKNGRVQPVLRKVPKTQAVVTAALKELLAGPSQAEQLDLGLITGVRVFPYTPRVSIVNGVARLENLRDFSQLGLAQIVYTATQFSGVKAVELGQRHTRADFEDQTPMILVESPLPFQHVTSPLRATGTANTFEATFNYDLVDPDGKVVATHFVTATSGSGQRGTYDFTVPFTVARPGLGKLVVYELSAKDGSRIHVSEIPVYLEQ
jgi:germination protein M